MSRMLSILELATLTGRDRATVKRRLSHLVPQDGPKAAKLYDARDALPLLVDPPANGEQLDLAQERAALARSQRLLVDLRIERERGALVPADAAGRAISRVLAVFRQRLLNLPYRLAAECAGQEYAVLHQRAETLVHEALSELADSAERDIQEIESAPSPF